MLGPKSMSATLSETPHALMLGTESAPNSHASSFDGSLASQSSTREPSAVEVTKQSKTTSSQDIDTPPTTASNFSSQESTAHELRSSPYRSSALPLGVDSGARLRPLSVDVNGAHKPHAHLASLGTFDNIPNKRLANGEIKHGEKSRSSSPPNPERYVHSRGTILNSKDSPIGDVSFLALAFAVIGLMMIWFDARAAFKPTPHPLITSNGKSSEWLGVSQH